MASAKSLVLGALLALATVARSQQCDDIDNYFGDVGSVSEIDLGSVIRVDCPSNDDAEELPFITIESGKTLTVKSSESFVRFVNLRFIVEEDATLIFDMPVTRVGPNSGQSEGAGDFVFDVAEGGTLTFNGKFRASKVDNVRSVFYNRGSIEFKDDSLFNNNGNVFRSNEGTIKFRGDAVFKNNFYLAIDNDGPDSFVRFSKTATFQDNAGSFDGAWGCAIDNGGTAIFRGDAVFLDHGCDEGAAVSNTGKMRFYGKAYFSDNRNSRDTGGGVINRGNFDTGLAGDLVFKGAVQFNRNIAEIGGGIAVTDGTVEFKKGVTFDGNAAEQTGGALAVTGDGSVTFKKPDKLWISDNTLLANSFYPDPITGCSLAYVEDGATITGFDVDDVCEEITV
ncbi:unnamed protein product [Scytosiphon promiscuus]